MRCDFLWKVDCALAVEGQPTQKFAWKPFHLSPVTSNTNLFSKMGDTFDCCVHVKGIISKEPNL